MNNTVTTSNTKEFSNINTNEPITVDKAISLEDEVQSIHFSVTTPAKENDMNFKNCENNDLRKHICKLEAQLPAIKSYVNCEVSILTNKIESISNEFENYSTIYNLSLNNVTFIHVFNNLKISYTNNKIMKHKNMMNYAKIIEHSNTSRSKTNWVSCLYEILMLM